MNQESALRVLLAHLDEEKVCLEEIALHLEHEAEAARLMDLDALVELSRTKATCVDNALKLARERPAKLQACRPKDNQITIKALVDDLDGEEQERLRLLREQLKTLSEAVLHSAQKAAARNESGLSILSGALKSGRRVTARHSLTYSAKGQIHTGVQFISGEGGTR